MTSITGNRPSSPQRVNDKTKRCYEVMNVSHGHCGRLNPNFVHGKMIKVTDEELKFYQSSSSQCGGGLSLLPTPCTSSALETHQFDDYYREKKNEMRKWLE